MARISYFFSVISPFTYLAGDGLEQVAAKHGAAIDYHPVDIMGLFGETGGTPPGQRHVSRQEYRLQEMRRVAARSGMALNMKPAHFPTDQTPASLAVIACQDAGGATGALVRSFLAGVWAEEANIADADVVAAKLAGVGLDAAALAPAMEAARETYAANLQKAVAAGAFGSPFYVVGEERFWGQDRLDFLDAHLAGAAAA